jgi:predicted secreted protein
MIGIGLLPPIVALSLVAQLASSPVAAPLAHGAGRMEGTSATPVGRKAPPETGNGPVAVPSRYEAFHLTVSCDEFLGAQDPDTGTASLRKAVRVTTGGVVTLALCSHPSTGFSWESPRYDPSALTLVGHKVHTPAPPLPGVPGSETWAFRTLDCPTPGPIGCRESAVTLVYSQSRAWGLKAAWTFTLTVRTFQVPVIDEEPPLPSEPGQR